MDKTIILVAVFIMLPVVILEYFVLIWIMGRGFFPLIAALVVFAVCVLGHIWLIRKFKTRMMLRTGLMISALMVSPIITVTVVMGLVRAFGIEIAVQ